MLALSIGIGFFLVALLWAAALLLELGLLVPIVGTLLAVSAIAGLVLARKRAKPAPAGTARGASAPRATDPAEVEALRAEVSRTLQLLRTSRAGPLPWYVLFGPSGSGKSTALLGSGLRFSHQPNPHGREEGATAHCDFWVSDQAVLVDTSGRYSEGPTASAEWRALAEELRRARGGRPPDALLLTVSAEELLGNGEEPAAAVGKMAREKLDELGALFQAVPPVYVIVNKVDLLPGFHDCFAALSKAERAAAWGFTFEQTAGTDLRPEDFEARFLELSGVLEQRTHWRLAHERDISSRERLFGFPQQFQELRKPLGAFLERLVATNLFRDTPFVRGVFFSSARPDGRWIDVVRKRAARALELAGAVRVEQPVADSKGFFLQGLFSEVIPADGDIVRPTNFSLRRKELKTYALVGAAFLVALLLVLPPLVSYLHNRDLVRAVAQASLTAEPSDSTELAMERLTPLREQLELLERHQDEGAPVSMRLGLYQGELLRAPLRAAFASAVRDRLLLPLLREDLSQLSAFVRRYPNATIPPVDQVFADALGALKLHLLLSSPRAAEEPGLAEAEQQWAQRRLMTLWKTRAPAQVSASAASAVEGNLRLYLRLVSREPRFGIARQTQLVAQARGVFLKAPYEDLALERIVAAADGPTLELSLSSLMGGSVPGLKSERVVRGAFTRKGWDQTVRAKIAPSAEQEDRWVLGGDQRAQNPARLQIRYYERYIAEWREFLASIRADEPRSNAEALALLRSLTSGEPTPLSRLWRGVSENVRLASAASGDDADSLKKTVLTKVRGALGAESVEAAVSNHQPERLEPADVERVFAGFTAFGAALANSKESAQPLALDLYLEQLVAVRDALQAELDAPGERAALQAKIHLARTKVRTLLDGQEVGWRPRLDALLWPPLEGIARASSSEAAAEASERWCGLVVAPFERALGRAYPFSPRGPDAPLADFVEFFRPGGALWGFVDTALRNDVERVGDRYQFAKQLGSVASRAYHPSLLSFLDRSRDITAAFFPPSSSELTVPFAVRVRPAPTVSLVTFEVDGQIIEYRNGPEEWHQLRWPNPPNGGRSAIRVRTSRGGEEEIVKQGEWSLFHLLESGTIRSRSDRTFVVTWALSGSGTEIEIEFRPARTEAPFMSWRKPETSLFRIFRERSNAALSVPQNIGRSAGGCRL